MMMKVRRGESEAGVDDSCNRNIFCLDHTERYDLRPLPYWLSVCGSEGETVLQETYLDFTSAVVTIF